VLSLGPRLWDDYVWGKQTFHQLSTTYDKSIPWIAQQLEVYEPPVRPLIPQPIVLVMDAFYFRRGSGIMLFRAANLHENLLWFELAYETVSDYLRGIDQLEAQGWTIQAVVCDGRPGVKAALAPRYPVQMCQFHQVAIVTRYLTRKPQLPAAIQLKALVSTLSRTNEATFTAGLTAWYEQWESFLKERTVSDLLTKSGKRRWWYTHRRIRAAYRSLVANLPYLFTHQKHPSLGVPNTTNSLDGSISHLRDKLRVHRGLKVAQRTKITGELLKGKSPSKFQ
jgi:hypothetical protein